METKHESIDVEKLCDYIHQTSKDVLSNSKAEIEKAITLLESEDADKYSKAASKMHDVAKILLILSKELDGFKESTVSAEGIVDKLL